jgi:hypothetical protein
VAEEGLRGSGAVGADKDVSAVPVGVGYLRESVVQNRDVIRGGVGSGIAGPQPPGHRLAGAGQEAHQRAEAEATLVGRGGLVLLRVAGDQRGVEIQDQPGQCMSPRLGCGYALAPLSGLHPGHLPGLGAG